MALVDHEDGIITTVVDKALGCEMIEVGQATGVGDRIHGMIQRLTSPPHTEAQTPQEMLEFYEIFKTISKGPLQTLMSTMMPIGNFDKAANLDEDGTGSGRLKTQHWDTWRATWGCGTGTGGMACLTTARHMMTYVNHTTARDR